MNVREFRYVCAIHEEGSITKAAARLLIAQPSLSKYINTLEEGYGMRIFDRSTSPWGLTDFGKEYIKTARVAINLERSLELKMQDLKGFRTGSLTLGMPAARASLLLPGLIPAFMGIYPGIDLQIVERTSRELEEMLLKGGADMCMYYEYGRHPMLDYHLIAREEIYLLVPRGYKGLREGEAALFGEKSGVLADCRFILLHPWQHIRRLSDRILKEHGLEPEIRTYSSQLEVTAKICAQGMGLTFVTRTIKQTLENNPEVSDAEYYRLEDKFSIPVVAVTRKGAWFSDPQKELVRIARRIYGGQEG